MYNFIEIDKVHNPVITFAPVKNSDCDKTAIGRNFLAQFNKRAVNPKRARFTNEYIEELPDLRNAPETFELQGNLYKRTGHDLKHLGHNKGVRIYDCKINCTNLVTIQYYRFCVEIKNILELDTLYNP